MIKILIADDHKVFREGIASILEEQDHFFIAGQAENGNEVLTLLEKESVDVILMDISMGETSGIDTTKKVLEKYPEIKVLVLSMHNESDYIINVINEGACGYLLKDCGSIELIKAINEVHKGNIYYSQEVAGIMAKYISNKNKRKQNSDIKLTNRESEILKLIANEYTNPEIAAELFISIRTVDTHRRNILEKLGVKNTAGLVKYAMKSGLVE